LTEAARPIAIFAPLASDAKVLAQVAESLGFACVLCGSQVDLIDVLNEDLLGIILSEEAAVPSVGEVLEEALETAPDWSALPVLFVVANTQNPPVACRALLARKPAGNIVLLERPVRPTTLRTVLQCQVRLRERQFQTADLLAQLQENERQKDFLLSELRHRSRNMLSIMMAMVQNSASHHQDTDSFLTSLQVRLEALAGASDRLTATEAGEVALDVILSDQVLPYCHSSDQLLTEGPEIVLSGQRAFDFSLIVAEMATNSAKYGGLSSPNGKVEVAWWNEKEGLSLRWTESGGPAVTPPERRSFGTRMIESLPRQYGGWSRLDFRPSGLVWACHLPDRPKNGG